MLKSTLNTTGNMNASERNTATLVGMIMSIRMLGLFIILPVFTLFAHSYTHATEYRIGLVIGIYGLTQALCQIPFGIASDIWGRKPVILGGLGLFVVGSIIAALSTDIYGLLIGRALQGTGAIGSVLLALLADCTRPQHRAKAMGIVGISIGASFSLAMLIGIGSLNWLDLSDLFWLTTVLGAIALLLCYRKIAPPVTPSPTKPQWRNHGGIARVWAILKNPELLKLNASIFFLHTILTALFVGMPVALEMLVNRGLIDHAWEIYLPAILTSLLLTAPIILLTERNQAFKGGFVSCVILIIISFVTLWEQSTSVTGCLIGLGLFFIGFNCLEAVLPSLVSRFAPKGAKGTAMSFYTSAQFLGIFVGGIVGGWLYSSSYLNDIFLCLAALATVWLAIAYNMEAPRKLGEYTLKLAPEHLLDTTFLHKKLLRVAGIEAIHMDVAAGLAQLTVDVKFFDARQVKCFEPAAK